MASYLFYQYMSLNGWLIQFSLVHLKRCLVSIYCIPSIAPDARDTMSWKTGKSMSFRNHQWICLIILSLQNRFLCFLVHNFQLILLFLCSKTNLYCTVLKSNSKIQESQPDWHSSTIYLFWTSHLWQRQVVL